MSRSELSLEFFKKLKPLGDFSKKIVRLPVVNRILGPILWTEHNLDATYIPVCEEIAIGEETVLPIQIVKEFVELASRRFILDSCYCRSSSGCKDYPHEIGCIFLGDAVSEINPGLGREVGVEEAIEHVECAYNHGLLPSIIHSSWDAFMLGIKNYHRMLAICFCCDCCCVFRVDMKKGPAQYRDRIIRLPGLEMTAAGNCALCLACVEACCYNAVELTEDGPLFAEFCKCCGRCAEACPLGNLSIRSDPSVDTRLELLDRIGARTDIG